MTGFNAANNDTGWITLTLAVGSGVARYRVRNSEAEVEVGVSGLTVTAGTQLRIAPAGSIPAAYCPPRDYPAAIRTSAGGNVGFLVIGADGSLSVHEPTGMTGGVAQGRAHWFLG